MSVYNSWTTDKLMKSVKLKKIIKAVIRRKEYKTLITMSLRVATVDASY